MQFYEIKVKKTENGLYSASCDAFNVPAICAPKPAVAVRMLKEAIESEGSNILKCGDKLPEEFSMDEGKYIVDCDIMEKFKNTSSEMVRRTVSLPKWMDVMIRNSEVDSSSVFREAIMEKIAPKDDKIESVDELKSRVDENILKEYVRSCLSQFTTKL